MPPSLRVKLAILGSTAFGITLIGILAAFFKRKRRRPKQIYRETYDDASVTLGVTEDKRDEKDLSMRKVKSPLPVQGFILRQKFQEMNGEIASRRSNSPQVSVISGHEYSLNGSTCNLDETASMSTSVTVVRDTDYSRLQPEQLCEVGMEKLQSGISLWEMALKKFDDMDEDEVDGPMEQLQYHISELLERAYKIQDAFESRMFSNFSTDVAMTAALQELDREYEEQKKRTKYSSYQSMDSASSDVESFHSALSVADLSDLEEQKGTFPQYAIYEAALLELEHGCIPCRTLRTKMLHCISDTEFLAKLHCVRMAFQELFKDETVRNYFADCNKQIITDLLVKADRDPEEFQTEYDSMMDWVKNEENWPEMEKELKSRGVKMMTFYDIVIDFLILDAFDDLDSPPSSVITVTRNRWLSNGFKETALSTAVWSVLKAKKRMLKHPRGFIAHFYSVSEHTSPVMAWGFLGPDSPLKDLCVVFKDQVLGFMRDVFSFKKVRYTTVAQLTDDIHRLARERLLITMNAISAAR